MKKLLLLFVLALAPTFRANAYPIQLNWSDDFMFAQTLQQLVTVSNDRNSDVQKLSVALNGSTVAGMSFETDHADAPADYGNFTLAQIEAANGVVLYSEDGHNAILLQGTVDSAAGKGSLRVSFLANGLTNNYKACNANLTRDTAGQWHLVNAYTNQNVVSINVKTWTLGISTVEGLCPAGMEAEVFEEAAL